MLRTFTSRLRAPIAPQRSLRSFSTTPKQFFTLDLTRRAEVKDAEDLVDISSQFKHIQTKDGTSAASDLARRLSQAVLPKLERPDVKKVCIVGSGGLSIGQAGEFDYSGQFHFSVVVEHFVLIRLDGYRRSSDQGHEGIQH